MHYWSDGSRISIPDHDLQIRAAGILPTRRLTILEPYSNGCICELCGEHQPTGRVVVGLSEPGRDTMFYICRNPQACAEKEEATQHFFRARTLERRITGDRPLPTEPVLPGNLDPFIKRIKKVYPKRDITFVTPKAFEVAWVMCANCGRGKRLESVVSFAVESPKKVRRVFVHFCRDLDACDLQKAVQT